MLENKPKFKFKLMIVDMHTHIAKYIIANIMII